MAKKSLKKGMNKGLIIGAVAVIVVLILIFSFSGTTSDNDVDSGAIVDGTDGSDGNGLEYTVRITEEGFVPNTLHIEQGDSVVWINEVDRESWPASNVHPTHEFYPNSDIDKCGTSEEDEIFDACRGLKNGESYSFVFTRGGNWGYHDHLRPSFTGRISVD